MALNEKGASRMSNVHPRRVRALVMIAGILTVFALTASGCGGGSLCCENKGGGSTEVIIQSADRHAAPAAPQVSEKGENR